MKALILASGMGKRLYPLTKDVPKSLIRIHGKEIIGYQINNLIECDIKDFIITTGPFKDKIERYVKKTYPDINVLYVNNPKYNSTNYIYSMWLTKKLIDDDIILLHGDLLFDKKLLERMINKKENCVLVNKKRELSKKDFKAVIKKGRIKKIGIDFFGKNAFACFPGYKFSEEDFLSWLSECEKYIEMGKIDVYAEDAFNEISNKILLHPLYFNDEMCMEIDIKEDIKKAEKLLGDKNE